MTKPKTEAIPVECMECGKKFRTRSTLPYCPRCDGADIEVRDDAAERIARQRAGRVTELERTLRVLNGGAA